MSDARLQGQINISSGSPVFQIQGDISQVIGLANNLVQTIQVPMAFLWNKHKKNVWLRQNLGPWEIEAKDSSGRRLVPFLALKRFEKHLTDTNGIVSASLPPDITQPSTLVAPPLDYGTASWAYLMFALGIHPGMGVVEWRQLSKLEATQNEEAMLMEINGEALCHIMNLFSVTLYPSKSEHVTGEALLSRRTSRHCRFPFGELTWEEPAADPRSPVHASFNPEGSEADLRAAKYPFGGSRVDAMPQQNEDDNNKLIVKYFTAMEYDVSDSRYCLHKNYSSMALPERIKRLLACFDSMMSRKPEDSLLCVSAEWFEQAARVKRRALADGGSDRSFFDDICKAICADPKFSITRPKDVEGCKTHVRSFFLFDDETFTFSVPEVDEGSYDYQLHYGKWFICEKVLLGYEHEPVGSWKRRLFDMREDVLSLLKIPTCLTLDCAFGNIQLLEFTKGCDLWQRKVVL